MYKMKNRVCSLFSGIGGIDLGFCQAGFEIVWANELDKYASNTYNRNFPQSTLVNGDLKSIKTDSIPDFDVLIAGFPCQSFSSAGKQRGFDDERGQLFFEIVRIVEAKKPSVIFLENVANLINHNEGKTFLTVYNSLVQYGYYFKYCVMDAQEYGNVPQHRERVFIVAFKDLEESDAFEFPKEIKLNRSLNDVIDRTSKHDESYYYSCKDSVYDNLLLVVDDMSTVYRIRNDGRDIRKYNICPTLTASMGHFQHQIPVVKDAYGIRKLTPYECLWLLGFPKDFRFPNMPIEKAYRQCGNSVCVPIVKRIAEQIMKVIE